MGTNYYVKFPPCPCCGHLNDEHIGKSSAGWTFSFHATDKIKSAKDWMLVLSQHNAKIYDEYGQEISFKAFYRMVELKKSEKQGHSVEYPNENNYLDAEGNSMSKGEFS